MTGIGPGGYPSRNRRHTRVSKLRLGDGDMTDIVDQQWHDIAVGDNLEFC